MCQKVQGVPKLPGTKVFRGSLLRYEGTDEDLLRSATKDKYKREFKLRELS